MEKTINIIGGGKLGMTLGRLWHDAKVLAIGQVLNRSLDSAQRAVSFIGAGSPCAGFDALRAADVWLLAVSDDALQECCEKLADTGLAGPASIVFHCSGALPSALLEPLSRTGAACASIHPICSFADPARSIQGFAGTFCGVEGDARALSMLEPAFAAIGAGFVAIDPAFKTVYHAAAVFASNYLVTVLDVAAQAYARSGMSGEDALRLMEPLVRGTVDNVFRLGTTEALTGPMARGDIATVVRQYRALKAWDEDRGEIYKQLGKLTAEIAARKRAAK